MGQGERGGLKAHLATAIVGMGLAIACLLALAPVAGARSTALTCDIYAAPTGSDSNSGTSVQPFLTIARLAKQLKPGQTGCLRGRFTDNYNGVVARGTAAKPITIAAQPGQTATVNLIFTDDQTQWVRIYGITVIGQASVDSEVHSWSVLLLGSHVVFAGNIVRFRATPDPTWNRICVDVGGADVTVANNVISHCGSKLGQKAGPYGRGIRVNRIARRVIVSNNRVSDAYMGIAVGGAEVLVLRNLVNATAFGIIVGSGKGYAATNAQLISNLVGAATIAEIQVEAKDGVGPPRGVQIRGNCSATGRAGIKRFPNTITITPPPTGTTELTAAARAFIASRTPIPAADACAASAPLALAEDPQVIAIVGHPEQAPQQTLVLPLVLAHFRAERVIQAGKPSELQFLWVSVETRNLSAFPPGTTVRFSCSSCPGQPSATRSVGGVSKVKQIVNRWTIPTGGILQIIASRSGWTSVTISLVNQGDQLVQTDPLCIPPGARTPQRCTRIVSG